MPPITLPAWQGERQAAVFGNVCMQSYPKYKPSDEALREMPQAEVQRIETIVGQLDGKESEDCLYLNMYAPTSLAREQESKPASKTHIL